MEPNSRFKRYQCWITVAGVGVLVALSIPFIKDLVILDEAIFAQTMRTFARTGSFTYYAGVTRGWQTGLWHPPTYVIYAALWSLVFGASSVVFRTATLLFTLITVPLVGLLATTLYRRSSHSGSERWVIASATLLYVASPLVVQNATLIDIDGSLLALVVTGYVIWIISRIERSGRNESTVYLGIAVWFTALSWIKFGALPVLLACTVGYLYLKRGRRQSLMAAIAAVTGFVVFTFSWWLVAQTFDFSFLTPFLHNFGSIIEGGSQIQTDKRLLLSAWAAYLEVLWLSPFLAVLAIFVLVDGYPSTHQSIREFLASRGAYAFAISIAFLTLIQYAVLAKVPYGFPKYLGIAMPLLCAVAATAAPRAVSAIQSSSAQTRIYLLIIGVSLAILALGDPFLVSFNAGYGTVVRQSAVTVAGFVGVGLTVWAYLRLRCQNLDRATIIPLVLFVLLIGTNLGILTLQVSADYSTRYNYGQQGTNAVIDETQAVYSSLPVEYRSESVLPRDFAFYIDGEFHIVREYSVTELNRRQPRLIVLRTRKYYSVDSPIYRKLRTSNNYTIRQYGSYAMFLRDDIDGRTGSARVWAPTSTPSA